MKSKWMLTSILSICAIAEAATPERIETSGRFDFEYKDVNGQFYISNSIESPSEMLSAANCSLVIISDDEYYNTYPGYFTLTAVPEAIVTVFSIESKYINENGRYQDIPILTTSLKVADQVADEKTWAKEHRRGNSILIDIEAHNGIEIFHKLTLGQPMTINLSRSSAPKEVTINMKPLTAKLSALARRCMKLIHNDG